MFKFIFCLLIIFVIIFCLDKKSKKRIYIIDNDLEKDIMHFLCNVLIFESNFNCKEEIFININFFDEYVSKRKEFDLLIKEKNTKIENLIMLMNKNLPLYLEIFLNIT